MEIFRNTENDPIATMLVLRKRIDLLAEMIGFHAELKEALAKVGVTLGF